jgi:hypothetical protein
LVGNSVQNDAPEPNSFEGAIPMETTWIVVADSSRARILEIARRSREIREIEDLVNPAGRAHNRDLLVDAYGRVHAKGGAGQPGHVTPPGTEPVEHEVETVCEAPRRAPRQGADRAALQQAVSDRAAQIPRPVAC